MATHENAAGIGLTILIATQIPSIYSNLLPFPCDIEKESPGSRYSSSIRKSEMQATIVAVGLGFAGALITETPWPFFAALAMAGIYLWHYETAVRYDGQVGPNV